MARTRARSHGFPREAKLFLALVGAGLAGLVLTALGIWYFSRENPDDSAATVPPPTPADRLKPEPAPLQTLTVDVIDRAPDTIAWIVGPRVDFPVPTNFNEPDLAFAEFGGPFAIAGPLRSRAANSLTLYSLLDNNALASIKGPFLFSMLEFLSRDGQRLAAIPPTPSSSWTCFATRFGASILGTTRRNRSARGRRMTSMLCDGQAGSRVALSLSRKSRSGRSASPNSKTTATSTASTPRQITKDLASGAI